MDALASLEVREIEVRCGEWLYTIPALPARDWLAAVLDPRGTAIFPGLLDRADRLDVTRAYLLRQVSAEEIRDCCRAALAAASGRSWWIADRLIRAVATSEHWPFVHGSLARSGVDLAVVPIAAYCDAVYSLIVERMGEQRQRENFDRELDLPPPGIDLDEVPDEADDFMAMVAADRALYDE